MTAIYLTKPDGTLRYCVNAAGIGTLGQLSKMSDKEIIALMDSQIRCTIVSSHASDAANAFITDFISNNNLHY